MALPTNVSVPVKSAHEGCAFDAADWLEWLLLTSEAVTTSEQASEIIGDDERRWLIEDDHKIGRVRARVEEVKDAEQGESDTDVRHAGVYRDAIAAVAIYQKGTIRSGRKRRSTAWNAKLEAAVVADG